MAEAIRLGRMTDTMEEGFIAEMNVKVGDTIKTGDSIADIETDKATLPLESYYAGIVLYVAAKKGDSLKIGGLIAIVGKQGEDFSALLKESTVNSQQSTAMPQTTDHKPQTTETIPATNEAVSQSTATSETTPVNSKQQTVTATSDTRLKASPLAKAIAKEKGIDLHTLSGTGEDGRIIKRDLENVSIAAKAYTGVESFTDVKLSPMRKTIAKRLAQSYNESPHFYLTIDINMDKAVALRTDLNQILPAKVSFNDLVIRAAALALRQNPAVNSSWLGESIRQYGHIHIGMAVAVEEGLVVPVIKFADNKSIAEIAAEAKAWGEKAKSKKLLPQDMEGSTFTISNLGMFGIEEFTAIINQPNACILAVGAIRQVPAVINGEIKPANMMKATLSSDHRVVDGAAGAKFMQALKLLLEGPLRLLILE
jgi:pyruvate dehydrogenase E2 component (dihydrolipoamide acetyltransferase)